MKKKQYRYWLHYSFNSIEWNGSLKRTVAKKNSRSGAEETLRRAGSDQRRSCEASAAAERAVTATR